ncbi:MAG: ATP-binding protein, partial [Gemmatimonadota bacterium]
DPDLSLSLARARAGGAEPTALTWTRIPEGWRGKTTIRYPDGYYNAHLTLNETPLTMRLARGALLIAFDLALLALLWLVGHLAQGIRIVHREGVPWVHTLRARITVALFVFFIVPTAVFGWLAYRGLSVVVTQAATAASSSAAQQAAVEWPQVGDLTELAQHAGTDVLYYLGGELADASGPEALALGIYNAWMEPRTFRVFAGGEEPAAVEHGRIGDHEYVTAYHVLQPTSDALAVPMGIATGETAQRQRDVAHLVLLAAVIGAALSMLLSIVVGRALAGPIGLLQRAASAVGGGRLSVRLPEPKSDEFGQLYSSFNRMVRQLRRARAREVRTARVLAWGEMARQIAHEIKNPLTPIRLAVQHLRRAWRDHRTDFGELLDENVDQVLIEIDRLNEIARAFSRYGAPRDEAGPLSAVDAARVIREALTLYRAGETGIRYTDRLAPSLPPVRARMGELREVLLNLLENARDAVDEGGEVIVAGHAADGVVEIAVSDSGPGIDAELIPHIFEPHFSTRSSGTGLGLAIVRRLVEGWGGNVDASSEPGKGTTLRFRIPVEENGESDGAAAAASPESSDPDDEAPGAEAGGDVGDAD